MHIQLPNQVVNKSDINLGCAPERTCQTSYSVVIGLGFPWCTPCPRLVSIFTTNRFADTICGLIDSDIRVDRQRGEQCIFTFRIKLSTKVTSTFTLSGIFLYDNLNQSITNSLHCFREIQFAATSCGLIDFKFLVDRNQQKCGIYYLPIVGFCSLRRIESIHPE